MQCLAHKQSSRNAAGVTFCLLLNRAKKDLQFTQIFSFFIIYLLFDCAGLLLLHAGFLQLQRVGAILQLWYTGFSWQRFLLLQSTGSRRTGFSSCGVWAQQQQLMGSRAWVHSRGTQAQLLCGTWNLPGLGIEPMSPALAGGFLITAPPGKSPKYFLSQASK